MDIGLTSIEEDEIAKHLPAAQSLVTQCVVLEASKGKATQSWLEPAGALFPPFRRRACVLHARLNWQKALVR